MKQFFRPIRGLEILPVSLGILMVIVVSSTLPDLWWVAALLLIYGVGGYFVNRLPERVDPSRWLPLYDKFLRDNFTVEEIFRHSTRYGQLSDPDCRFLYRRAISAVARSRQLISTMTESRRFFVERYGHEVINGLEMVWKAILVAQAVRASSVSAFKDLMNIALVAVSDVEQHSAKMAETRAEMDIESLRRNLQDLQDSRQRLEDCLASAREMNGRN